MSTRSKTCRDTEAMRERVLLLRKGRVLTPGSRLAYRLERLRRGKTPGLERVDEAPTRNDAVRMQSEMQGLKR